MFWGLIMEPNKRYTQTVEKAFHLSMASLDATMSNGRLVQVMVCYDNRNYLLCTLQKDTIWQVPLDLNFQEGTKIAFTFNGDGHVHLTGYLIPEDEGLDELDDFEEEDDEEIPKLIDQKKRKALNSPNEKNDLKRAKKSKVEVEEDEDDDDDESDTDNEDGVLEDDSDDDLDSEEEDIDEDESDEEEEDDEEEEVETPVKPSKKQKQKKNKQNQQNQQNQQKQQNQQNLQNQQKQNHQQNTNQQQSKKEKNKLVNGKDAKPEREQGKQKKNKEDNKTEEKSEQQQLQKRTVEGGVQIEDIKIGNGAPAKTGKFVSVYYIGRLKNGKKFDHKQQGEGFKFRLGKSEVIKGWDVGIVGMKVGGKRRIIIPPNMAYGANGSPPIIPGNSTLNFEVELKAIH